jgi:hypothetical protein
MSSSSLAPALHPRLSDPGAREALAVRWRERPALRIEDALAPGLAAELAAAVRGLPFAAVLDRDRDEVRWRCLVTVPPGADPQLPECLFRVARLARDELPPLLLAITGQRLAAAAPERLLMVALRKGSYAAAAAPEHGVEVVVGIGAVPWPAAWGGHTELVGAGEVWAPAADTLELRGAGQRARIPVLTRHVESLAIVIALEPA